MNRKLNRKSHRKFSLASLAIAALSIAAAAPLVAQTPNLQSAPLAATAPTAVPALVPYSGAAIVADGKPLTGEAGITFLIYADQTGGEPLFAETQAVTLDAAGHYQVQLGASLSSGLPIDLFASGEARWLEVQIAGQPPQSRVLLASVPYALKSADAATLGGLPASAFVLAGSKQAAALATQAVSLATTTASDVTTTGGTTGNIPLFTGASTVANSTLFQDATGVGVGTTTPGATLDVNGKTIVRGTLDLSRSGNATAAAGFDSVPLVLQADVFNSATAAGIMPFFQLQAEPAGNNTASPSLTLNLLSSATGGTPAETGLYFNPNGTIHFAPGQTFPGGGTITAVAAGTGLTGGGASGNVTLNVDTTKIPVLAAASNTFTGSQNVGGSLAVAGSESVAGNLAVKGVVTAAEVLATSGTFSEKVVESGALFPAIGIAAFGSGTNSYPLDLLGSVYGYFDPGPVSTDFRLQTESSYNGTYGYDSTSLNVLFGSTAASMAETGLSIASNGALTAPQLNAAKALVAQPAGVTATPALVIQADDNGISRTAASQLVIQGASIPGQQLLVGYLTDANTNSNGGLATIQATWQGYLNTALALQPNGGCVCIRTGLDGALAYEKDPLVVGQGQGNAVADGWATYSSRRFKTDIQTLTGALDKVERMRGVSYTLKATGKREIGVIAEEVGAVVPEVVTYEANGKDARSVDYNRLTALLIEAAKQQQAEVEKQQTQIAAQGTELTAALRQIRLQQAWLKRETAAVKTLRAQVRSANETAPKKKKQPYAELAMSIAK